MLPESQFPVTGGIMQTEEVVPCAQPTGLEDHHLATTDRLHLQQQPTPSLLFCPPPVQQQLHLPYPDPLVNMAVKQEPQEHEDERSRQSSTLGSAPTDHEDAKCSPSAAATSGQSSPEFEVPAVVVQPATAVVVQQNGCKKPPSRIRRKSRWKLKFHHQALPPEYLDHYEAALAQEAATSSPMPPQQLPPPAAPSAASVDVQSWLQRLAAMQSDLYAAPAQSQPPPPPPPLSSSSSSSRRSVITSTQQQQQQPRPPMKYSDLPYMGEITLDNSKPRRGRKPKKADICHLIYKNYGTILPGTPGLEDRSKLPAAAAQEHQQRAESKELPAMVSPFQRTDIQNRISSLLEKRLTQERRALESSAAAAIEQEEPMNLCIRDLNLLKIRLAADRQQPRSDGGGSSDHEDAAEVDHQESKGAESQAFANSSNENSLLDESTTTSNKSNPNLLYWPSNNAFLHPVALQSQFMYYQKLAQQDKPTPNTELLPKDQQQQQQQQRIVPKSIYSMLEAHKPAAADNSPVAQESTSPRPKRTNSSSTTSSSSQSQSQSQPVKRKRSAIFIPPMPTENNNNPATEVSICKFKFTGGAKPSLQEKKSLSVDSGGNFRYYSGTGDKSMRGYEFFPRESLQQPQPQPQQQNPSANNTGAFLNAAAERLVQQPATTAPPCASPDDPRNRKTRKTRKSVQREKLEQTFKEKGFLIQTQQLESAEGATYCKFRQLRKFTRYLFRSWKDYLPGELTESDAAAAQAAAQAAAAANELQQQQSFVEPSLN